MKIQTTIFALVAAVALCTFPTLASANDFSDLTDFRNLYSVKVNFGKSVNQHNRFTFTGTVPAYLSLRQPLEKFNLSTGAKVGIGIGIGIGAAALAIIVNDNSDDDDDDHECERGESRNRISLSQQPASDDDC